MSITRKCTIKTSLSILFLTRFAQDTLTFAEDNTSPSEATIGTRSEILKTLKYCTTQILYHKPDYPNMDLIPEQLENLNSQLSFNFVIENINSPTNRYVLANSTKYDEDGIILNFPYPNYLFNQIYSNCHLALMFSPPWNPILLGMSAFNEDPDYIVIIGRQPAQLVQHFNYYFYYYPYFKLTSIILHFNKIDSVISLVCHTCSPPKEIRSPKDYSTIANKLVHIKKSEMLNLPHFYKRLTKDMNQHFIRFAPLGIFKLWESPCNLRHCGLDTSPATWPVSDLKGRLNFTVTSSMGYSVGYVYSNKIFNWKDIEEKFTARGLVSRYTWIKHGIYYDNVVYKVYALPAEINADAMLNIFDILTSSLLLLLGSLLSLFIFLNKKFVFVPVMWTVSMFLQQSTNVLIKPEKYKVTKLRVLVTHLIIFVWLINAFIAGSMFSGEFYSIFTSNRTPELPRSLAELITSRSVKVNSFSGFFSADKNNDRVSCIKGSVLEQMKNAPGYSPRFYKLITGLQSKLIYRKDHNIFGMAYCFSLNKPFYLTNTTTYDLGDNSVFAVVDPSEMVKKFETFLRVFKKYFIIPNNEANLDTNQVPWVTWRTLFGAHFETNLGYLVESGVLNYWETNRGLLRYINEIKRYHNFYAAIGRPQVNYTNYFQNIVLSKKEKYSVGLYKEGEPINVAQIKMLFILYAIFICLSLCAGVTECFNKFKFLMD
ncbi:hypothetical protein Fcan01_22169 [Folsomia candida]|uniref:Uncharacterized protein n=1 Tax=Folsomia candida TaxID=158441 RepID=A0A226DDF4_FOLCA|nr:hypothetical protein Fcan01_22169 [Folsomia candida]